MATLFKTMAEYQQMFSRKEDGRRNNAILFSCYKDRGWRKFMREEFDGFWEKKWFEVRDMNALKNFGFYVLQAGDFTPNVHLMNFAFYSPEYRTDEMNGICEDGTPNAIRYINLEVNRAFRMKSGRFLTKLIEAHDIGRYFPLQMKSFLCEEFSRDWLAYTVSKMGNLNLRTDLTFADIYGNGGYSCYDMGSCMNGRGQDGFYDCYVDATPAALVDDANNEILARCVIFNEVTDERTGEKLRLAERQYAKGGDNTLKKALVELLIARGLIDGFKSVGAGCGDARAFVRNDGSSLSDRCLSIACSIDWGDTLSYQDSFKWYSMREQKAYNYSRSCDVLLDTTDDVLCDEDMEYDEYHDRYTRNGTVEAYCDGSWIRVDENELDDFVQLPNDDWVHEDEARICPHCGDYFCPDFDHYYSELLGEDFCCEDCREEAEREYKKEHWKYSKYDDAYFENEDDVVPFLEFDWTKQDFVESSICVESLVRLYLNWYVEKRKDIFYYAQGKNGFKLTEFLNEALAV